MDDASARAFLSRTREQAQTILDAPHIGADVKNVIKDLIQISTNFDQLLQHSSGQSADTRVLKKRLEQAKTDMKAVETKYDELKKLLLSLIDDVKVISAESQAVARSVESSNPLAQNIGRIRTAVQKMAETIIKATTKS